MQVVGSMEGASAASVRTGVQSSVGVSGEVAVQFTQLVVRFVAADMMTDVRPIRGRDDGGSGRGRLLNDGGSCQRQGRRWLDERLYKWDGGLEYEAARWIVVTIAIC